MIKNIKRVHSAKYSSFTAVNQLITSLFPHRISERTDCQRSYYDTFDWRLYNAGYLLEEDIKNGAHELRLTSILDDASIIKAKNFVVPRFYWDLPPGCLKDTLKPLINERALLPMGTLFVNHIQHDILNQEDKILLRIVIEGLFNDSQCHQSSGITTYLELHPLRGYEEEMTGVLRLLSLKFDFNTCRKNPALALFEALGKKPGGYTSAPEINLEPDIPSHTALSSALIHNLEVMEKNEPGILKDIDIEFLHDFRVAGRRSRSVLAQVRDVYPKTPVNRFKNSLSWLSKLTSSHRDLDVFLRDFNQYDRQISHNGGEELEPLRHFLQQQRALEHEKLVSTLRTKRFNQFKNDWRMFLEEGQQKSLNSTRGTIPIIDVANQSIWRNYRKLLHRGDIIKTDYTFEALHNLRKDGKKLRYLIDTFRTLYPANDMQAIRKCLKRLQNNLGDITDMHVQRCMLDKWKTALATNETISPETIDAIDELENQCTINETKAQKKFKRRYQEFSSGTNKHLFEDMFKATIQ